MTNLPAPEPEPDEAPVDDPYDDPDLTKQHDLPPGVEQEGPNPLH
ncbi:hypothetical protein [Nocardioides sp. MH1]